MVLADNLFINLADNQFYGTALNAKRLRSRRSRRTGWTASCGRARRTAWTWARPRGSCCTPCQGASTYDVQPEEGRGSKFCGQTEQIMQRKRGGGVKNHQIMWTSYMEAPSVNFPERPTERERADVEQFVSLFGRLYPCRPCAEASSFKTINS